MTDVVGGTGSECAMDDVVDRHVSRQNCKLELTLKSNQLPLEMTFCKGCKKSKIMKCD